MTKQEERERVIISSIAGWSNNSNFGIRVIQDYLLSLCDIYLNLKMSDEKVTKILDELEKNGMIIINRKKFEGREYCYYHISEKGRRYWRYGNK